MARHDEETIRRTKTTREQLATNALDRMLELHEQLTACQGVQSQVRDLLGVVIDLSCTISNTIQAARKLADDPTAAHERELAIATERLESWARRRVRNVMRKMEPTIAALANVSRLPTCYACDAPAIGVRDRRPEGGKLEHACKRHQEGQ